MKGISYIGAYNALKNHYGDDIKIKSIIGSSAGGILGLAICCGLSDEEIKELCLTYLSRITIKDKKYKT